MSVTTNHASVHEAAVGKDLDVGPFLEAGEILGAGGTAIWKDGKLYRAENFKSQRILTDGPVRATFEPTHRCTPMPKLKCRLPVRSRITVSGSANTAGSRLAIAHEIHSRSPSLK